MPNASAEIRSSQLSCQACPNFATTRANGATSIAECGCKPGYHDVGSGAYSLLDVNGGPKCEACGLGEVCSGFNTTKVHVHVHVR